LAGALAEGVSQHRIGLFLRAVEEDRRLACEHWAIFTGEEVIELSPQEAMAVAASNIARPAGDELIVDVDRRKNGFITLTMLQLERHELPETRTVTTWSGGKHLCYRLPESVRVKQSLVNVLGEGIDIKAGNGGYVLCPGSTIEGKTYEWTDLREPVLCPDWVIAKCKQTRERDANAGQRIYDEDKTTYDQCEAFVNAQERFSVPEGKRDNTAFRVACKFYDYAATYATCLEYLEAWNDRCCVPPLSAADLERISNSAATSRNTAIGSQHADKRTQGFEYVGPADEVRDPWEDRPGNDDARARQTDWGDEEQEQHPKDEPPKSEEPKASAGLFKKWRGRAGSTIPPRPWIASGFLCRERVTMLAGPGGVAKSTYLIMVAALAERRGRFLSARQSCRE
jgi:hypothetical protein